MNKKVMIVDDEPDILTSLKTVFQHQDYEVITVDNGYDCISEIEKGFKGIILMDIMMPGEIDGLEATRIIKNDPRIIDCKIIMLTVKGQTSNMEKGFEAGADGYFSKPFSPLDLIRKVEEIIE